MGAEPKRKRGRPPGPCATAYRRSPVLQVPKTVGVPLPLERGALWTETERVKLRAFDKSISADREQLFPQAWTGHPIALLELERRFGVILFTSSGQPLLAGKNGGAMCLVK